MPTYKRDGGYRDIGCPSNAIEKGSRLLERIFGRSRKRYQSASPVLWIHLYNYRSLIRRLFPTHFPIRFPLTCFPRLWTMYVHICVFDPFGWFRGHDEDVPQNENLGIVGGNLLSMLDRTFIFFSILPLLVTLFLPFLCPVLFFVSKETGAYSKLLPIRDISTSTGIDRSISFSRRSTYPR